MKSECFHIDKLLLGKQNSYFPLSLKKAHNKRLTEMEDARKKML